MGKTAVNWNENIAGALCYVFGPLSGFIMYVLEMRKGTKNKVVLFNALQSIVVIGGISVLRGAISFMPLTGFIMPLLDLGLRLVWAYLIYQAFTKKIFKVPVVGDICLNQVNKK